MKKAKKTEEDWMQRKWRPMMAIMYMVVCIFDFIIFPIGFTVVQFWENQAANDAFRQWQPLTLVGAGLFHMAMGAVLGITAWSRGQEKIAGVATTGMGMPSAGMGNVNYNPSQGFGSMSNVGYNTSQGFGNMSNVGYNTNYGQTQANEYESSYTSVAPVTSQVKNYKGKAMPVQPPEPEL